MDFKTKRIQKFSGLFKNRWLELCNVKMFCLGIGNGGCNGGLKEVSHKRDLVAYAKDVFPYAFGSHVPHKHPVNAHLYVISGFNVLTALIGA